MKLIYIKTGELVKEGDKVQAGDGETLTVEYFRPPHKPSSSGKVSVSDSRGESYQHEYYVSVIGAKWIEREDQIDFN